MCVSLARFRGLLSNGLSRHTSFERRVHARQLYNSSRSIKLLKIEYSVGIAPSKYRTPYHSAIIDTLLYYLRCMPAYFPYSNWQTPAFTRCLFTYFRNIIYTTLHQPYFIIISCISAQPLALISICSILPLLPAPLQLSYSCVTLLLIYAYIYFGYISPSAYF
jgi:hypothetical protein